MAGLPDSSLRVELLMQGSEKVPCGGAHAYKGIEQCSCSYRESVLFCFHGNDDHLHEYINDLRTEGKITAQEAEQKHAALKAITHELAMKDIEAEALGFDAADDDEIARTRSRLTEEQLVCVRKKVMVIRSLQSAEMGEDEAAASLSSLFNHDRESR